MTDPASGDEEAVINKARALLGQDRPSEAAHLLRMHLQRQAGTATDYMLLGVALSESGEGLMALQALDQAVALEPDNAVGHYNLGQAYQEFGRHREARTEWERALELRPDYPAALRAIAEEHRDPAPPAVSAAPAKNAPADLPLDPAAILADGLMMREREKAPRGMIAVLVVLALGLIGLLVEPYVSGAMFLAIMVLEMTVVLPLIGWCVYWLQIQSLQRKEEGALRRGDRFEAAAARADRRLVEFLSRWL